MPHQSMPCHTNIKPSQAMPSLPHAWQQYHHFKTYMHLGYEP
jgi:hypothetical protein